ncbi:MAG: hypothetical protein Q7U47_14855 [Paludibacter sp.]|nr:hypothetical protein [Paludibacter sp.]
MAKQKVETVRELIYLSYANLAMAHTAIDKKQEKYGTFNFMIRARLFKGLKEGTMNMRTIFDDEKIKLQSGQVSNAYFMLAGTTNHMQTHFVNGLIVADYLDGSSDTLKLINPENWCPIEQDYYVDGKAFKLKTPRPYRVHFKTGLVSNHLEKELGIEGVYGRKIDGGAGVLLDMPLDKNKKLRKIYVETIANDVIIGLMSLTLQR